MNKSQAQIAGYTNWRKKLILMLLIGSLGILGVSIICLNFGVTFINPKDIISLLLYGTQDKTKSLIIWQ